MLSFTPWTSPTSATFQRIYIRGLPTTAKAYLARTRGKEEADLIIEPPLPAAQHAALVELVIAGLCSLGMPDVAGGRLTFAAAMATVTKAKSSAPSIPASPPRAATARQARPTYLPQTTPSSDTLDFSKIIINPPGLVIYADHREPESIVQLLRSVPNITVVVESLPVGDFRCGAILIERKVINDFEQSVISGRLFDETTRIALEPNTVGIVIIEGDFITEGKSLLLQSLQGAVTCLSQVQGMSVLTTPDHLATAYFVIKHCQHAHQGLGYELPLHRAKPKDLVSARAYLLQALPGVSGQLASTLVDHFGSAGAVFRASRDDLLAVKGLGPKTADAILAVLV